MCPIDTLRRGQNFVASSLEEYPKLLSASMIGSAVFLACLLGIYTRPIGFMAMIWPANAIMLGMLLRVKGSATVLGWISATAAFIAADMLGGSSLPKTLLLTSANLLGIATSYLVCSRLSSEMISLRHPTSMLYVVFISGVAASIAGVMGAIANPILFDGSAISGWTFWFATEFANYLAILPVILTIPAVRTWAAGLVKLRSLTSIRSIAPVATFALSCLIATLVGGPGAIAFPVPALLWCGLVYSVFPTAMLTLIFGGWSLSIATIQYLPITAGVLDQNTLVSIRLGTSLIALSPIMVASVMTSRNELLSKFRDLANHDQLTGAKNRHAFFKHAQRILDGKAQPVTALVIDIDHFKSVNDTYGHPVGDEVLAAFTARVSNCLRPDDVLGRLGGEEFAVLVADCPLPNAVALTERLLDAVGGTPVALRDGRSIKITASIGIAISAAMNRISLDQILAEADAAMYNAKNNGRNRAEHSVPCDALTS